MQYNIIKAHKIFDEENDCNVFYKFWGSGVSRNILRNILKDIYDLHKGQPMDIENPATKEALSGNMLGVQRTLLTFERISVEIKSLTV